VDAWGVDAAAVDDAAMANLAAGLPEDLFETTPLPPTGRAGRLLDHVEPAVLLLPEFLKRVRAAWGTDDDLVVLMTSGMDVRFIEAGNRKLLDMLEPSWRQRLSAAPAPLCRSLLKIDDKGIRSWAAEPPPTQPAPTQPATRIHIVF